MILKPDRQEIYRYMGYSQGAEPDEAVKALAEEYVQKLSECSVPRHVERYFDIAVEEKDGKPCAVRLTESGVVFESKALAELLSDCKGCVIMAASLGIEAEKCIRRAQAISAVAALAADACATALIESCCDLIEAETRSQYGGCTWRFSPGYGDLPIELQSTILNLLDAGRAIGLSASATSLLIPRKSVTAIMGIGGSGTRERGCQNKCQTCENRERCTFYRDEK